MAPSLQTPSASTRHRRIRDLFGKEGVSEQEKLQVAKQVEEYAEKDKYLDQEIKDLERQIEEMMIENEVLVQKRDEQDLVVSSFMQI